MISEKSIQPIYYPSIDRKNFIDFKNKFFMEFNDYPNHLSLLSYDLVGLIYYLSVKNGTIDISRLFKNETSFKGKIGIFDIENNKINHRLNFYEIESGKIKKIF